VRFDERLTAALAAIALRSILGFPKTNDLRRFDRAVPLTPFIGTKLSHLGRFVRHVSSEYHLIAGSILPTIPFREIFRSTKLFYYNLKQKTILRSVKLDINIQLKLFLNKLYKRFNGINWSLMLSATVVKVQKVP